MPLRASFSVCISSVIHRENNFLDYRYTAKNVIEKLGMEAVRNPEDIRNQNNFEAELRENCDFFVLLLGSTPSKMVESELKIALSRGISILVFVKVSRDKNGTTSLPDNIKKNLMKISPELYNTHIITFENCETLASALEEELEASVFRKIRLSPLIGLDPPIAYTEGVKLIREAKYRIVLSQRTSCLVLGPRKNNNVEETFYNELLHWLDTGRKQTAFFVHYFSLEETRKAMATGEYALEKAKENFEQIFNKHIDNNFAIRVTPNLETVTHLIADTGLGLNFWIGNNRYYLFLPCFLTKDSELQGIITNVQRIGDPLTTKDIPDLYDGFI
jgi:hypothetical protein